MKPGGSSSDAEVSAIDEPLSRDCGTKVATFVGTRRARKLTGPASPWACAVSAMEKEYLARLMEDVDGNLTKAAKVAGLTRKGVRDKLKKFGLYKQQRP